MEYREIKIMKSIARRELSYDRIIPIGNRTR